jgi:hypothetical protein
MDEFTSEFDRLRLSNYDREKDADRFDRIRRSRQEQRHEKADWNGGDRRS